MSILIYTEHQDGKVKKNSLEAISYGVAIAALQGTEANVLVVGQTDAPLAELGKYGVKKVYRLASANTNTSDTKLMSTLITLNANAFEVKETGGSAEIIALNTAVPNSSITITAVNKTAGEIPLSEADRVISGGRGLKGPENWGMIEELAKLTGAATACSRAVADAHWRPHHEHVGQTGLAISPNLYFAVGISGAIQHLAGVNRSKTIVVINKDPEAPFFKAADYGIVGDAFEVMPKIIQAVKDLG